MVSIKVAGAALGAEEYSLTEKGKLSLASPPATPFELEIETDIKPQVLP